jgi:hypothetical protein
MVLVGSNSAVLHQHQCIAVATICCFAQQSLIIANLAQLFTQLTQQLLHQK